MAFERSRLESNALRVAGVLAIAAVLRPSIAGVGPIIDDIRDGLGLPSAAVALLTTLPLVCFGIGSLFALAVAGRFGVDRTLAFALGLLAVALLTRVLDGPGLLFTGTVVSGGAIAIANVLLPRIVKQDFSHRVGLMTGVYTAMLGVTAAIAALIAVPLKNWTGAGWRGSLMTWGVVAFVAFVVWLPQLRRRGVVAAPVGEAAPAVTTAAPAVASAAPAVGLLRNPRALALTAFMGLQSLSFYVCLSWLPSLLKDAGYSSTAAGAYLSLLTALGIPMALIVPGFAARARDQRLFAVGFSAVVWIGFFGLLIAPGRATALWVILLGIGTGSTFPLTLLMMVLRASTPVIAGQLSAMSQGFGYLLAACGPFVVGVVHDAAHSWKPALIIVLVLVALQGVVGAIAGRSGLAA